MKKLVFDNVDDCAKYLESKEGIITNSKAILAGITEAFAKKKTFAETITFELATEELELNLSVSKEEWQAALEHCLKYFEEFELADESIDTYMLLKKLKEANFK